MTTYSKANNKKKILKYVYNIKEEQYIEMLKKQNFSCMLCKEEPKEDGHALSIDHDHSCCPGKRSCGKCIRGLLCANCNHGLGYFKNNPNTLKRAIAYLERNEEPS